MELWSVIILIAAAGFTTHAQNLCKFTDQQIPSPNASFIENFSTSKCLKVQAFGIFAGSKVVLDDCSYWKTPMREQQISMVGSAVGKILLKTNAGMGEAYCLTTRDNILYTSPCQSSNSDQNWTLKKQRDNGNQFLIEQYSSKKCLLPKSREKGSTIKLAPCNSYETEQIWKICTKN